MKHARISPLLVAEELLNQRAKRGEVSLTPLQLIKMVYLCQGWSLGAENTALFEEDIEAWKYGPVIPSVYYAYREFGKKVIPLDRIKAYPIDEDFEKSIDTKFKDLLKEVVEFVLDVYGEFTGTQLSNLTHKKDTPWSDAYDGRRNKPIRKGAIQEHFQVLTAKHSKAS